MQNHMVIQIEAIFTPKECPEMWVFRTQSAGRSKRAPTLLPFSSFTKLNQISFFFFWSVWSMIINLNKTYEELQWAILKITQINLEAT